MSGWRSGARARARQCGDREFKWGAGCPRTPSLLSPSRPHSTSQSRAVSAVIDEINARFGKGSIMYLSAEPIKM